MERWGERDKSKWDVWKAGKDKVKATFERQGKPKWESEWDRQWETIERQLNYNSETIERQGETKRYKKQETRRQSVKEAMKDNWKALRDKERQWQTIKDKRYTVTDCNGEQQSGRDNWETKRRDKKQRGEWLPMRETVRLSIMRDKERQQEAVTDYKKQWPTRRKRREARTASGRQCIKVTIQHHPQPNQKINVQWMGDNEW